MTSMIRFTSFSLLRHFGLCGRVGCINRRVPASTVVTVGGSVARLSSPKTITRSRRVAVAHLPQVEADVGQGEAVHQTKLVVRTSRCSTCTPSRPTVALRLQRLVCTLSSNLVLDLPLPVPQYIIHTYIYIHIYIYTYIHITRDRVPSLPMCMPSQKVRACLHACVQERSRLVTYNVTGTRGFPDPGMI